MRILGIDPGCGFTGYGIIETDGSQHASILFGAIGTPARQPLPERLLTIYTGLTGILGSEKVDMVAIEEVFHATNFQSALKLGHARGVALLAAGQHHLPVFEYSALEIKSSIVGYGRAEKAQIQAMVRFLLKLPEVPKTDAADALAVAICHSHLWLTRRVEAR